MILMFLSSSRDKFTLLWQNSVTELLVSGRHHSWSSSMAPDGPAWRLHTNLCLYKFVSLHILLKKYRCDLNLSEGLCIFTFFLFPDFGLDLLNDFDFYFDLI